MFQIISYMLQNEVIHRRNLEFLNKQLADYLEFNFNLNINKV